MELSPKQQQKIAETAKNYRLTLMLLFGSQSDGRTHKESDVDIAYVPGRQLTFKDEYHLNYELTNIFRTDRVDTVDLRKAPALLSYAIFQHPVVLYQQNELVFPSYQAYAFKKYIEAKPLYEEKFRRLAQRKNSTS